jgi:predicted ATPase/DNA-binding CsgD family transcriptional regulator/Tfp pilus assembly protein PilF
LIGRDADVAAARARLLDDGARLLTLTGPGGVGKTRLAVAVARAAAPAFADGVAFVDLAPVVDPALVASAVARAVGAPESGEQPPLADLLEFLRRREMLLVLDNFEHVLAAAPAAAAVLERCPDVALLATSRVLLRLAAEHAFPVEPLPLPAGAALPEVAAAPAVQLFVARARAAAPGFALAAGNAAAVAAVCRRLDGLPLAIELAAARTTILPPAALLGRLERRLALPLAGPRDAPARQHTLRDAIAWSHDLLAPADRVLLRRLAVFAGGATLEAIEHVAADPADAGETGDLAAGGLAIGDVVAGVASLVDHSLLRVEPGPADEPRYGLLETIRAFAFDELVASGEEPLIRRRHAAYVGALVAQVEADLWREPPSPWLARLEADLDNLRATLAWALAEDPATALRIAGGLWKFWQRRDRQGEGRAWLERALDRTAGGRAEAPAPPPPPAPGLAPARARALAAAGALAAFQDDHAAATTWLEEAVADWRTLGDPVELARALLHLGETTQRRGDPARATALWEEALARFRPREDARDIAEVHNLMGLAAIDLEQFARAEHLFERALALGRGTGDQDFEVRQLMNMGVAAGLAGNWPRAAAMCEEALAAYRANGVKLGAGYALLNLGDCLLRLGEPGRALPLLQESLALTIEIDNREGIFFALEGLAPAALAVGRPRAAARFLGAADGLRAAHGVPPTAVDLADRAARIIDPLTEILGAEALAATLAAGRLAPWEVVAGDALALVPDGAPTPASAGRLAETLTPREVDIVRLVVEGRSDKEIAADLGIARRTASNHIANVRDKLGVSSRGAVAVAALRDGLLRDAVPAVLG